MYIYLNMRKEMNDMKLLRLHNIRNDLTVCKIKE